MIRKGIWIAVVAFASALVGCSGAKAPAGPQGPPEVGVITLATRSVGIVDELPGRTVAYRVAEVRPQVSGHRSEAPVRGRRRRARRRAALPDRSRRATARHCARPRRRCSARRRIARRPSCLQDRYGPLRENNLVSQQAYDDAVTGFSAAEADVAAAKAQVESARINVVYCQVLSPIAGRIGRTLVTEGALVTSQQSTPLALVQQLDPIYVDITQSSVEMLKLQRALARGELQRDEKNEAEVSLTLEDGSEYARARQAAVRRGIGRSEHGRRGAARAGPESAAGAPARDVRARAAHSGDEDARRCWCRSAASRATSAATRSCSSSATTTASRERMITDGARDRQRVAHRHRAARGRARDPRRGCRKCGPARRSEARRARRRSNRARAAKRPRASRSAEPSGPVMSRFFIDRPIFAWVHRDHADARGRDRRSCGCRSCSTRRSRRRRSRSTSNYPGASAQTVQDTVTQVIEQQMSGIDNLATSLSTATRPARRRSS